MPIARHVLAATDFSDASAAGLQRAAAIAAESGCPVTLVHVFDPSPLAPIATRGEGVPQLSDQKHVERAIHTQLETLRDQHFKDVEQVGTALVIGTNAAEGIVQCAKKHGADLIVLATHGRTGLAHLLIGSVAEKVVRHAECSVLTVRSV